MNKHTYKFWNTREVALLKEFYDIYTPMELVELTGHSVSSVHTKIRTLKLVLTERKCRQCGYIFKPTHKGHIYCSKSCGGIAYRARKLLEV